MSQSVLLAALLAAAWPAHGCGVCIEDKVAAVYDHGAVNQALEAKNVVAFFAIEGAIPQGAGGLRRISALAAAVPGVDRHSVRISREAASLAIAFDPRRATIEKVQQILDRKLAAAGLSLVALRVMASPGNLAAR